ncbi:MAG: RIP metalloprotease RseP [Deltaproteobacteria bacterium]|nr:RIP metalloprotease RseP [Deltaproteobacteria bacterium]
MSLIYFIIFLGALIFFHELGHYLAARLVGVTVLRFSIGFGPRLFGFTRGDTEYQVSALPLGGYVKFLGDDPEDPPEPDELKQGFLTTDLWRKVIIVLAGPVFNLILPFLIFFPMYASEPTLARSELGSMSLQGPASQAGLKPGDRVVAIDGTELAYWWELLDIVSQSPGRTLEFTVERDGDLRAFKVTPEPVELVTFRELGLVETVGRIDVALERVRPVVMVRPGSPAASAGLRDFDAVMTVDGKDAVSWADVARSLEAATRRTVVLEVVSTTRDSTALGEKRTVRIDVSGTGGDMGVSSAEFVLDTVLAGSPADRAGLKEGDRIVEMDGSRHSDWAFLVNVLTRDPTASHELLVAREGREIKTQLSLENPQWTPGAAVPRYEPLGSRTRRAVVYPEPIPNDAPFRYAAHRTVSRTGEIFTVTLAGIFGLVTGKVSLKEMGGPIMIYDIASSAGDKGWATFLGALAWISINLGILNLLPIPVLDGGHLVLFGVEAVRRKPIGRKGRQIAGYVGLAFLLLLMVLVFANDIERKWGALSDLGPGD